MTHDIKVHPEYFAALVIGDKKFELRQKDRPYAVGDELLLREWSPQHGNYTGDYLVRKVTFILDLSDKFLFVNYVILSIDFM